MLTSNRLCGAIIAISLFVSLAHAAPIKLAAGEKHEIKLTLKEPHSAALAIKFSDADFAGATILANFNGKDLLPYHAFGGDTRYDGVKNKPGLHSPLAKIEAHYVL